MSDTKISKKIISARECIPLSKDDFYNSSQSKFVLELSTDNKSDETSQDETAQVEVRQNWGNRFEFLLACVGYSVGLGKNLTFKKSKSPSFIFSFKNGFNRKCMEIRIFML